VRFLRYGKANKEVTGLPAAGGYSVARGPGQYVQKSLVQFSERSADVHMIGIDQGLADLVASFRNKAVAVAITPALSVNVSSPLKPNLTSPERAQSRAKSPVLVSPTWGCAPFPTRTTVSLSVAFTTRPEDANAGSSCISPRRARSSTRPEKLRGIRSEILPTTQESQYRCFYLIHR
jgi:hypothetical protein